MKSDIGICGFCRDQGITGWNKPISTNHDGTLNMVFVPQFCQCEAGQSLAKMNAPDAKRTVISSIPGLEIT